MAMSVADNNKLNFENLNCGNLKMLQPEDGPRVNADSVMLSSFANLKEGESAIELGCAHGFVSLILALRFPNAKICGLEIQPELLDMAHINASENSLSERVQFMEGDLRNYRKLFKAQSFDVVVTNPPYDAPGRSNLSSSGSQQLARQGTCCLLSEVCDAAKFLLKNKGRLYMVMRAVRLAETLFLLRQRNLEPKVLRAVYPLPDQNASVFLVEARRAGGSGMTIEPPLYIYDEKGDYTKEFLSLYQI